MYNRVDNKLSELESLEGGASSSGSLGEGSYDTSSDRINSWEAKHFNKIVRLLETLLGRLNLKQNKVRFRSRMALANGHGL